MNLHDIIIDKSPAAKAIRLDKLRAELAGLGYLIVSETVLAKLIDDAMQSKKEIRA